jgi:RNA-directed DNA polymerase
MKALNESLMERILERENLREAYRQVKANAGAAGVDRMEVGELPEHIHQHWPVLKEKLLQGRYKPSPVRAVEIPKAQGGVRRLGIPTVQDRWLQQAMHQVLSPLFEPQFSDSSYGFRPGRSAHDAVRAARGLVQSGKTWVVDIDLEAFFDQVDHDLLLQQLRQQVAEPRVLGLIGKYLRAGLYHQGELSPRSRGTPQGGPLSPLLANIYLTPLDRELERRGLAFCRYADDITIYVNSERSAERVLASVVRWIERDLKLPVNRAKSGTGRPWERRMLGFRLLEDGTIAIAPKSLERYRREVRRLWDARQSLTSKELIRQWQRFLIGWWNYFQLADVRQALFRLDGWVRRHMRKCFWLRWHDRKGRRNALQRLGARPRHLKAASSRVGAWRLARSPILQSVLANRVLRRSGLLVPSDLAAA